MSYPTCAPQKYPSIELRRNCLGLLLLTDPVSKVEQLFEFQQAVIKGIVELDTKTSLVMPSVPGRPIKPDLVDVSQLSKRSPNTTAGRASMIHSLAHIEFNAINLALDAIVRFEGLPDPYYWDWWTVAYEEATHFQLLSQHLNTMGYGYGDFPAHNGLWEMAEKTQHSLGDRMAMVPRTLEARGLDACPLMKDKLLQVGDEQGAAILDVILRDEIKHVSIGHQWFVFACERDNVEPILTYRQMSELYKAPKIRPPFNYHARQAAGFYPEELELWQNQIQLKNPNE